MGTLYAIVRNDDFKAKSDGRVDLTTIDGQKYL